MSNVINLSEVRKDKQKTEEKQSEIRPIKEQKYYHGHRSRARQRLMQIPVGETGARDIVEILLFYCYPRMDTKPMADALIKKMGSISKILFATKADIQDIPNLGDSFLSMTRILREIIVLNARENLERKSDNIGEEFSNWDAVYTYLRSQIAFLNVEQFRILILNSKNCLVSDVIMSEGTVNHTSIYVREVVKAVLDYSGVSVILAHNHPSGDVKPSRDDIDITSAITNALNAISVRVQDHIIIGGHSLFSFREENILPSAKM